MTADEPTKASASQEEKGGAGGARKRRRRRRPRRKAGTSTGSAASQGQVKKTGGQSAGGKGTSAGGRGSSSGGGAERTGTQRSRTKQRGGKPDATGAKPTGAKKRGAKGGRKGPPRRQKIPTTREVSAGGVVYRKNDDGIEVVLASRRTRRGQLAWGLAKGGIEEGETKEVAAIREVREETGMTAVIEADLGDTKYMYVWDDIRIRKTVHFFLMRHTGGNVDDRDDEMEEIRWFPMERAIKRAAYRGERDMLVKASELLK
jgi:8-oxo-dGTP pyrophosphatase MutT (NUDIX family)